MAGFATYVCMGVLAYLSLTAPRSSGANSVDSMSDSHLALDFAKRAFRELGDSNGNITSVAELYQVEFDALNTETNGTVGQLLTGLFEMRVLDITTTLDHTLSMQSVLHELMSAGVKRAHVT